MNTQAINDLSDTLSFASPEHVLAWMRGEAQRGFIVYFKEEFLAQYPMRVQDAFPYFRLTEINLLRTDGEILANLRDHCSRLHKMFQSDHPYRVQMLQALLLMLLYDCKRLYDDQNQIFRRTDAKNALVFRFQQFVNQHFITRKTVADYAHLLAVSPDHLGQTIKAVTGRTAHNLITERIVLEAKKLLTYSDLNIAEIAAYLGYDEPTHFGRFFRRQVGVSPFVWRHQKRQS